MVQQKLSGLTLFLGVDKAHDRKSMSKGVLRFFFDYGAGGCLWAGDEATLARLDVGPVDAFTFDLEGRVSVRPPLELSEVAQTLRDRLDFQHSRYLNPIYPPDPSLWSQALCDRFNDDVDRLLAILRVELGNQYEIRDEQIRYVEDPELGEYLTQNPTLSPITEIEPRSEKEKS
ncbi:MAG: hypothetical protein PGN20_10745 [Agrobacterium cavarae]